METCESCRFYFPIDKNGNQGQCRSEPPRLFVLPAGSPIAGGPPGIELRALHPVVVSGAWCGRYEKRTEPMKEAWENLDKEKPLDIPEDKPTLKLTEAGKAKYIASCSLAQLAAMHLDGEITTDEFIDEEKRRKGFVKKK